jgi:hypothetical protein
MLGWILLALLVCFLTWAWWRTRGRVGGLDSKRHQEETLNYFNWGERTTHRKDERLE